MHQPTRTEALAKANLKEYSEAIADYDKAIELDPNFALAYYNRGITYRELGKEEEAKEDFKKAQELDPTLIFQETKKAKKEVREEVKEEIKETAAETQKTQDFQEALEDLKKTLKISEFLCLIFSVFVILITAGIFILPFFEDCLTCWVCFKIPENFLASYFLFPFLEFFTKLSYPPLKLIYHLCQEK